MIKLPYKSICGLSKLCFLVAAMLFTYQGSAQIVITWPDFLNNNSDAPIFYNQSESLTGCTSISFSMEYSSDDWLGSGSNNLESVDECNFGDPCNGDPFNPMQGDCDGCWDFLLFELDVDGVLELGELIGTTLLITNETYTWDSGCLDPNETVDITLDATSQTWANDENIDLTNITIICYQGVAEDDLTIDPGDELCEGDNLDLSVSSMFTDAEWFFEGSNIGTGTDIELTGLTTSESGTYSVETTDVNGCSSSVEFDIEVEEIPMSCPVTSLIEACENSSGFAEINLTLYDAEVNCFGSDDVLWFENTGDIPDFPIIDPTTYESDGSDLFAVVFNGLCYSTEQLVFVDTGSGISPEIEIDPSTICEGENLVFQVMNIPSCGTCDFVWDGPAGSGITGDATTSDIYQVLNANNAMSGTWTVTVTDDTGCSGSTTTDVVVTDSPTGTISGGGDLCPGFCTDVTNELTLNISGGTAPYIATISVLGLEFDIPVLLSNGAISLCADPSAIFPSVFDINGDGVPDLVVPAVGIIPIDFDITLLEVIDDNGCVGSASGTIGYTINIEPNASSPGGPFEQCAGMLYDLTTYNDNINGAETILWFEDINLTMPIASPGTYVPGALPTTVYAVVDNGTCLSEPVSLELTEIVQPMLDPIANIEACDSYEFIQPSGSDLGVNFFYADDSGTMFFPGDVTTVGGTYTITAGDNPDCLDTETFEIIILDQPSIVFPTSEISACGEIMLPTINVLNFDVANGDIGYYEASGQSGTMYFEGDAIDQSAGLTSIFVYAGNGLDCFDEVEIELIFSSDIEYILPPYPTDECGDLELLPIGGATAGVAYYTEPDGGGVQYLVGDILEAPGTYTLYIYDATIDQTCVLNSNESFEITLEAEPILDPLDDVTVCESEGYVLPDFTGTFLTGDEGYSTATGGGGTVYEAGDTIFVTTSVFIFNETASCPATELVFEVTAVPAPNAGVDNEFQTCIGPVLDMLNFISLDADTGGSFIPSDGSITLSGADNNLWDTSTADENTPYVFTYMVSDPSGVCDDASIEIIIELTNDVSAGMALPDSTICQGDLIDLFGLIDGESTGGYFLDQDNLMDTIFNGEWMATGNSANFSYIIEADGGCNGDQSSFSVNVIDAQMVTVDIPTLALCEGSCVDMIINSNFNTALDFQLVDMINNDVYDLNVGVDGMQVVEICADGDVGNLMGNTISLGDAAGEFVIAFAFLQNVENCETDLSNLDNFNIELITAFEETVVGEVCENEGFIFQGEEYFDDETLTGLTAAGCDSTTIIEIVEFPPAENFENDTYCIGTEVSIGGEIYTENTELDVVLMGASANGCDSTIYIDIAFDNASYNDVSMTICSDEQQEFNDITYDIDNPSGADTIINGSVLGCDSIITVMLEFYPQTIGQENPMICQGDTVNILGVDFYAGMEQMEIVLENQSVNGCDSIVEVSIGFLPTMEIDTMFEKCQGDTLFVDGFEITDDNLNGFYTLTASGSDCASIVNYFTEQLIASNIEIDTSICQGETIEINGIEFSESYTFDQMVIPTTNGCDSTVTISVNIETASVITMSETIAGNNYQISYVGENIIDPIWNTDIGNLSCSLCESPSIIIEEDTEVYFTGITENGCLIADTLTLSFLPEAVFIGIYTPNVFSPDDDNFNRIYTIFGTDGFTISEMNIYDRWGNEVYSAEDFDPNDETIGWDGRMNGVEAEIGVYVGRILYVEEDGTEGIKFFDLTLLR